MVKIDDPRLEVQQVEGALGRRRLVVSYRLVVDDPVIDAPDARPAELVERAVVSSRNVLDAPVAPVPLHVEVAHTGVLGASELDRRLVIEVDRADLDVQRDWWRTDHGGGVEPIAEMLDHIGATITVEIVGQPAVSAETPIVTGSWGALGAD